MFLNFSPNFFLSFNFKLKLFKKDQDINDGYKEIEKIGEGSFGIVYKAQDKKTNEIVALKRIQIDK